MVSRKEVQFMIADQVHCNRSTEGPDSHNKRAVAMAGREPINKANKHNKRAITIVDRGEV